MLLGDGSPTRHLQLLTNQETKIKLISMQLDPLYMHEGPKELNQLNGPLIRRQVWIKNNNKIKIMAITPNSSEITEII